MKDIKRYSRQDLNDMKVLKQDRRYIDYFEAKAVVETMRKRLEELEAEKKELDMLLSQQIKRTSLLENYLDKLDY